MAYNPVSLLPHDEDTASDAAHANNKPVDKKGIRVRNEESASEQDDADPNGQAAENAKDKDGEDAGHLQETQREAHDE